MRTRLLLLIAVVALFLAACGNDDSPAVNDAGGQDNTQTTAATGGESFTLEADLKGGTTEVPQPGDPEGTGSATVKVDAEDGKVCYTITVDNITEPKASHIHEGAAGASGAIVITFDPTKIGKGEDCLTGQTTEDLQRIVDNPAGFYVNVHTADFQAGAVRGQLSKR